MVLYSIQKSACFNSNTLFFFKGANILLTDNGHVKLGKLINSLLITKLCVVWKQNLTIFVWLHKSLLCKELARLFLLLVRSNSAAPNYCLRSNWSLVLQHSGKTSWGCKDGVEVKSKVLKNFYWNIPSRFLKREI